MAARNWREVRAAADLNEDQVAAHRQRLDEEVRAYRLAEVRRRQDLTQEQVASAMGVRRPRVSQTDHPGPAGDRPSASLMPSAAVQPAGLTTGPPSSSEAGAPR